MQRHYTLIELIVTIAVITILTSLLISVMQTGMKKQEEMACVANGKGVMAATFMHSNDNTGYFPHTTSNWRDSAVLGAATKGGYGWDDNLLPYFGINLDEELIEEYYLNTDDVVSTEFAEVLQCPGSDVRKITSGGDERILKSYLMHEASWLSSGAATPPWRFRGRQGIGSRWVFSAVGNDKAGYTARMVQLSDPSTAIAYSEYNNAANVFGTTEFSTISLDNYVNKVDVESFWPHGLGKMTIMLSDGSAKNLDIQDTINPGLDIWAGGAARYEDNNGLWDCWPEQDATN